MKTIAIISISILTMFITSCGSNSGKESESKIEAPAMDIHTATFLGDMKAIQQHIDAGSDLNVKEPTFGSTPLISASVFGKTEVAKALIEAGADINLQNNEGSTALHSAAFLCHIEIVKMLLDKGVEKNLRNLAGSTPLESVMGPFADVKPIYDIFSKELGPLGLKLDYSELERIRPEIAELLK